MPGVARIPERLLAKEIEETWQAGIRAVLLFGVSHSKTECGTDAGTHGGLLARMVKIAKDAVPDMVVMADICMCAYTSHGHCGILDKSGYVDNDATIQALARQATVAVQAGADIVDRKSVV